MSEQLQYICFKSILRNHKITCDSVIKWALSPLLPLVIGQKGYTPVVSPLPGIPEITYGAVM